MSQAPVINPKIVTLQLLKYSFCEDFVNKRMPFRDQHLLHIGTACKNGVAKAGGASGDPITDGLIIFAGSKDDVQNFVDNDPYYLNGLVTQYSIEDWYVVSGYEIFE
ncbi:hypothetical protein MAH1_01690 [Sessilibacter sp. MAH1]